MKAFKDAANLTKSKNKKKTKSEVKATADTKKVAKGEVIVDELKEDNREAA